MAAIDDAFRVVELDWPTFPTIGKQPLIKGGFHNATLDKKQVQEWQKRWPRCGWAIATGPQVCVVDVDILLAVPDEILTALENSTGPRARSGSGGLHYYFRSEQALTRRIRFVGGTDFCGANGYAVIPNTIHPKTRQRYCWLTPPEADLPLLPKVISDILTPATPKKRYRKPVLGPMSAMRTLRAAEVAVTTAVPGERNATLNREAFRVARFVKAGILNPQEVVAHLKDAALNTGLDDTEVMRTIRSGLLSGMDSE